MRVRVVWAVAALKGSHHCLNNRKQWISAPVTAYRAKGPTEKSLNVKFNSCNSAVHCRSHAHARFNSAVSSSSYQVEEAVRHHRSDLAERWPQIHQRSRAQRRCGKRRENPCLLPQAAALHLVFFRRVPGDKADVPPLMLSPPLSALRRFGLLCRLPRAARAERRALALPTPLRPPSPLLRSSSS